MAGPIARAYVTITADASSLGREIEIELRKAFAGIDRLADRSAREISQSFARAARDSRAALEQIDPRFADLRREAGEAGERMQAEFQVAAARINQILDTLGERSLDDLGGDAKKAAIEVENALRAAALAASQALSLIGEGAFRDLEGDARVAATEVTNTLLRAAAIADAGLGRIGEGVFEELHVDAVAVSREIQSAFAKTSAISRQSLRDIGGEGFLGVAADAQVAAERMVIAFSEAAQEIDAALDASIEIDTNKLVAQVASVGPRAAVAAEAVGNEVGAGIDHGATNFLHGFGKSLARSIGVATAFAAGTAGVAFVGLGIKISSEFQRIEVGLQSLISSAKGISFEAAKDGIDGLLRSVQNLALTTPFAFKGLAENVQQLLAAGRSVATVIEDARALGGVAALLGGRPEDLHFVIRAIAQINSSRRVYQQDLNQIVQRLPGFNSRLELTFQAGAKAAGLEADEIGRIRKEGLNSEKALGLIAKGEQLVASGAVSGAEGVDLLIQAFAQFPGAQESLERFARSLQGQLEHVKEVFDISLRDGFAPLNEFLVGGGTFAGGQVIGSFLARVADGVRDGVKQIGLGVTEGFKFVATDVVQLVRDVAPVIGSVFAAIARFAKPIVDSLRDFFSLNGDRLGAALRNVGDALGRISAAGLSGLLDVLTALIPVIDIVATTINAIPEPLLEMVGLAIALKQAFGPLVSIFTASATAIGGIGRSVGAIIDLARDAAGFVSLLVTQVVALAAAENISNISALGQVLGSFGSQIGATIGALGPAGVIAGAFAGIAVVGVNAFIQARDRAAEFNHEVQEIGDSLQLVVDGQLDLQNALKASADTTFKDIIGPDELKGLKDMGIELADLTGSIAKTGDALVPLAATAKRFGIDSTDALKDLAKALERGGSDKRFADLAKSIGLSQGELSDLVLEVDEFGRATEKAAGKKLREEFNQTGDDIDRLKGKYGSASAALQALADIRTERLQAALKNLTLGEGLADGVQEARDAFAALQQTLDDLQFPDALSKVKGIGLGDAANAVASAIVQGLDNAEALKSVLDALGVSVVDVGTVTDAAVQVITDRITELGTVFSRLAFPSALAPIDEFTEGLKSKFASGAEAVAAFTTNYNNLLDAMVGEQKNLLKILNADLDDNIEEFVDAVVKGVQGTPDGATFIAGIADLIGKPEDLNNVFAPIIARVGALGNQVGVDLVHALEAGKITFNDLVSLTPAEIQAKLDGIAAAVDAGKQKIVDSVGGLHAAVDTIGEVAGGRISPEDRLGETGGGGAPTASATVDAAIGDVVAPAKTAAEQAVQTFTETATAGFTASAPLVSTALTGSLSSAFALVGITLTVQAAVLQARFAGEGTTIGTAFGTGFGVGATAQSGAIGTQIASALASSLADGFASSIGVVVSAVGRLTAALRAQLVGGILVATAVAVATYTTGLEPMGPAGTTAGANAGRAFTDALRATLVGGILIAAIAAQGALASQFGGLAGLMTALGLTVGIAFGNGIAQGIRAAIDTIRIAAQTAAVAASNAARSSLRISSPSKVGIEIGQFFGRGMAIGVRDLVGDVANAGRALAGAAVQNTNLSVPALSAPSFGAGGSATSGSGAQQAVQVVTEPHQNFNFQVDRVFTADPEAFANAAHHRIARRVTSGGFKSK